MFICLAAETTCYLPNAFFNVVMFFFYLCNEFLISNIYDTRYTNVRLNTRWLNWIWLHAVWFSNNIIRSWFRSDWTRHRSSWTLSLPDYQMLRSVSHIQAYSNESSASAIINCVRKLLPLQQIKQKPRFWIECLFFSICSYFFVILICFCYCCGCCFCCVQVHSLVLCGFFLSILYCFVGRCH